MDELTTILDKEYLPSGDCDCVETAASQLVNESELESTYKKYVEKKGLDSVAVEIFFKLFNVWIGMYRLDKCEKELVRVEVVCGEKNLVRVSQCWAFLKWKQGKYQEAMKYFKQMEELAGGSDELWENMAHTYSSMGQLDLAEEYFARCMNISGGVLLGKGLLYERQGNLSGGLSACMEALNWYASRFSLATGHCSSLEAKCSSSLARMYLERKNFCVALLHANNAVNIFYITCGADSPLLASALRVQAQILFARRHPLDAIHSYTQALEIETHKDGIDLMALIEIQQGILDSYKTVGKSVRLLQKPFLIAAEACAKAERVVEKDGNLGALHKIMGELGVWAEEYLESKKLFEAAIPFFRNEKTMDCSNLIEQCESIILLLDKKLANRYSNEKCMP